MGGSAARPGAFLALEDPTELGSFGLGPQDVVLHVHQTEELPPNVHQVLLQEAQPNLGRPGMPRPFYAKQMCESNG